MGHAFSTFEVAIVSPWLVRFGRIGGFVLFCWSVSWKLHCEDPKSQRETIAASRASPVQHSCPGDFVFPLTDWRSCRRLGCPWSEDPTLADEKLCNFASWPGSSTSSMGEVKAEKPQFPWRMGAALSQARRVQYTEVPGRKDSLGRRLFICNSDSPTQESAISALPFPLCY